MESEGDLHSGHYYGPNMSTKRQILYGNIIFAAATLLFALIDFINFLIRKYSLPATPPLPPVPAPALELPGVAPAAPVPAPDLEAVDAAPFAPAPALVPSHFTGVDSHKLETILKINKFYKNDPLPFDTDECVICCEEFIESAEITSLPVCQHTFHAACIFSYFRQANTCPICRQIL